jgi:hypothetical protein
LAIDEKIELDALGEAWCPTPWPAKRIFSALRCAGRECGHVVCNAGNAHQQGKVVNEYAARSAGTG